MAANGCRGCSTLLSLSQGERMSDPPAQWSDKGMFLPPSLPRWLWRDWSGTQVCAKAFLCLYLIVKQHWLPNMSVPTHYCMKVFTGKVSAISWCGPQILCNMKAPWSFLSCCDLSLGCHVAREWHSVGIVWCDVFFLLPFLFRRGNPLHLCPERYKTLHKFWLSHSIPETIGHLLESNTNLLAIEWQHLWWLSAGCCL